MTAETADEWTALANDIRIVDGNHDLGAGELAARLVERGWRRTPRAALLELRRFAEAHHGDETPHIWLHGLTVDIPARIDAILELLPRAVTDDVRTSEPQP